MTGENTANGSSLFTDERLLDRAYVPEERLVGREELIANIEYAVTPMVFGREPENLLLTGSRGTGKTMCARYVARREVDNAAQQGLAATATHVDCRRATTDAQATREIAGAINRPDVTGVVVPESGLSLEEYHRRLREIIDELYDVTLVILDHLDYLDPGRLLRVLSDDNTDSAHSVVTIIGIVDGEGGDKRLSEATVDTVAEEHYVFEPYEESQLREILDARRAAFHDEAVTDTVIERAAELAATGGGDAGEGIALLHEAGLLAQRRGETTVRPDHVTAVSEDVDALQLCESLAALPVHARYVLEALTRLSAPVDETDPGAVDTVSTDTRIGGGEVERSETEGFRTTRVYEAYESVCADVGDSPRTLRRVQEFLGQLAAQGVTERSAHWGGRAEGNYYTHRLTRRPAIVHSAVECTAEHDDGERLNIP